MEQSANDATLKLITLARARDAESLERLILKIEHSDMARHKATPSSVIELLGSNRSKEVTIKSSTVYPSRHSVIVRLTSPANLELEFVKSGAAPNVLLLKSITP